MKEVLDAVVTFSAYALIAVLMQNAVFARGLGVSRLIQLMGDGNARLFGLVLCAVQLLTAPLAWLAGTWIAPLAWRAAVRPLVYIACITVTACVLSVLAVLVGSEALRDCIPRAAFTSCVLGTLLVSQTQSFTLLQSMGFGLGSGLGYILAVALVAEAQVRLRRSDIPAVFRGLPITLIYIGILALAIYGFIGHAVIL